MFRRSFIKSTFALTAIGMVPVEFVNLRQMTKSSSMIERIIPSSNEALPVVGLGTWIQFDVENDSPEIKLLKDVLVSMNEYGGKMIDSSPMYGRSEKVVGDLTAEVNLQSNFFYATKVWTSGKQNGIDQMNASLKKMRRKQMDLMQVHNLQDWKTHLKTLKDWKAEGRIRYLGLTHYLDSAHEELLKIITKEKSIDFIQFNFNIAERNAEKKLLQAAMDNGVAVIINRPYMGGNLFRKTKNVDLPEWSKDYDIQSWGQFFLKYIISHPAVSCVIPGTSKVKHLIDNMKAGYGRLPEEKTRIKMKNFIDSF